PARGTEIEYLPSEFVCADITSLFPLNLTRAPATGCPCASVTCPLTIAEPGCADLPWDCPRGTRQNTPRSTTRAEVMTSWKRRDTRLITDSRTKDLDSILFSSMSPLQFVSREILCNRVANHYNFA